MLFLQTLGGWRDDAQLRWGGRRQSPGSQRHRLRRRRNSTEGNGQAASWGFVERQPVDHHAEPLNRGQHRASGIVQVPGAGPDRDLQGRDRPASRRVTSAEPATAEQQPAGFVAAADRLSTSREPSPNSSPAARVRRLQRHEILLGAEHQSRQDDSIRWDCGQLTVQQVGCGGMRADEPRVVPMQSLRRHAPAGAGSLQACRTSHGLTHRVDTGGGRRIQ